MAKSQKATAALIAMVLLAQMAPCRAQLSLITGLAKSGAAKEDTLESVVNYIKRVAKDEDVREMFKNAAKAGGVAFATALLFGPAGLNLGATLGGYVLSSETAKSLLGMVMSPEQEKEVKKKIDAAVEGLGWVMFVKKWVLG
ncbi:hypothetical protein XENTR_v10022820 [Xenopus tropicalis]|uniref:Uncharacterized protein LOC100488697 n=1 Tax=Xenopus tropicalis TaxID=8364 RepID=A0A1B8Y1R2_XENTR|eukprot:XP_002942859.1 PREDICTED: uncharacterized protein LOC100488697 [Xenopus tropicalis]